MFSFGTAHATEHRFSGLYQILECGGNCDSSVIGLDTALSEVERIRVSIVFPDLRFETCNGGPQGFGFNITASYFKYWVNNFRSRNQYQVCDSNFKVETNTVSLRSSNINVRLTELENGYFELKWLDKRYSPGRVDAVLTLKKLPE